MLTVFLTPEQKYNLGKWKYSVEDKSITTKWFTPFWNFLVKLVPNTVAPNVLSLSGLLCILYAFHLTYHYIDTYPILISLSAFFLIFTYMNLDAIDGKHARLTSNSSPLGELFDHSCDNVSVAFLVLIICYIYDITSLTTQWYLVQGSQLVFLESHIRAYRDRIVKFSKYGGPGEFLVFYLAMILVKILFGTSYLELFFDTIANIFGTNATIFSDTITQYLYFVIFFYLTCLIISIKSYSTRNGLLISMAVRLIPSFLYSTDGLNTYTIIANGLIMSVLTGDIIVAKMANRDLHQLVPILTMLSLFDNFLCVAGCVAYYGILLYEISTGLGIPILSPQINVYCNGVFDMFHEGHMQMLKKAASHGTNLIVGVHSDASVMKYKRQPIMSEVERYRVVGLFGHVNKLVENADLCITEEFIKENNIHVVLCSPEYDSTDDIYYAVPRRMGILKVTTRTDGISTSDLIKRIKERNNTESKQIFGNSK
ncbi:cytidyltransferaserelated domain containing protein [Tupanvirus deep ocean]|uniref:Cytidyltransferaserelated domain containing protein n=2 Tax=Tupanvirus TaxID=2094720 RepID=A0AC62A719_9VIRU|nr:cytidyltransferaserelated domain containing protein [Tupanvirus deep ocean]QKU33554.1 cytidyltransferaserelated domain containing protein [Tupanvirus deep ocean]